MLQRDLQRWDESSVPQTCRLIDKVVNFLYSVEGGEDFISEMEDIRVHNDRLREWGATVNCDLTSKIDDLEYDLKAAQRRITELEDLMPS